MKDKCAVCGEVGKGEYHHFFDSVSFLCEKCLAKEGAKSAMFPKSDNFVDWRRKTLVEV
jgi:hypothetical protein